MWNKLTTIDKILVPVDLTDASLFAVEAALAISREKKSQIYLIHVITNQSATGAEEAPDGRDAVMERKERAMEEFFLRKVKPQSKIACIVRHGNPSGEILTFAREEAVDLIVLHVGADPRGEPLKAGRTADRVVRNAVVPVLLVRPGPVAQRIPARKIA